MIGVTYIMRKACYQHDYHEANSSIHLGIHSTLASLKYSPGHPEDIRATEGHLMPLSDRQRPHDILHPRSGLLIKRLVQL